MDTAEEESNALRSRIIDLENQVMNQSINDGVTAPPAQVMMAENHIAELTSQLRSYQTELHQYEARNREAQDQLQEVMSQSETKSDQILQVMLL